MIHQGRESEFDKIPVVTFPSFFPEHGTVMEGTCAPGRGKMGKRENRERNGASGVTIQKGLTCFSGPFPASN